MPLIQGKSKKAFQHNMKAEMDAGKPQDQSLAISYSIQRKNKKKMYEGGVVSQERAEEDMEPAVPMRKSERMGPPEDEYMSDHFSEGGSVADEIMRKKKMYAEGGEVDLSENAEEEPNNEDDMSYEALKKENYSESDGLEALDQPEDSNEKSHEPSDSDEHDMVESIRRKMRAKRGM